MHWGRSCLRVGHVEDVDSQQPDELEVTQTTSRSVLDASLSFVLCSVWKVTLECLFLPFVCARQPRLEQRPVPPDDGKQMHEIRNANGSRSDRLFSSRRLSQTVLISSGTPLGHHSTPKRVCSVARTRRCSATSASHRYLYISPANTLRCRRDANKSASADRLYARSARRSTQPSCVASPVISCSRRRLFAGIEKYRSDRRSEPSPNASPQILDNRGDTDAHLLSDFRGALTTAQQVFQLPAFVPQACSMNGANILELEMREQQGDSRSVRRDQIGRQRVTGHKHFLTHVLSV